MTLNITVAGPKAIYQSADFRLKDTTTGRLYDFETQKIILVQTFGWAASVCFAGVGKTPTTDVSVWLTSLGRSITGDDPLQKLIDGLLEADSWLAPLSGDKRHSFTVGAFVGGSAIVYLISNFETMMGVVRRQADRRLSVHQFVPSKPRTFVSGDSQAVKGPERRQLAHMAMRGTAPDAVQAAMASLNRTASSRSALISSECFTSHLDDLRRGSARPHGLEGRTFFPQFAVPIGWDGPIAALVREKFGAAGGSLRAMSFARFEATDDYHLAQIEATPNDANAHCNYGAFLHNRGETTLAEAEYCRALELDPSHANSLGNLANLRSSQGRTEEGERLYAAALDADEGNENISLNFARHLWRVGDTARAVGVVNAALSRTPDSGRLLALHGELLLMTSPQDALRSFAAARASAVDQAAVQEGYAFALHLSGADPRECIREYRAAIGLSPDNLVLHLNLAQLLFIVDAGSEAETHLATALAGDIGPDAEVEARFYQLAHTSADLAFVLGRLEHLHGSGARLRWNVAANIEAVCHRPDADRKDLAKIAATLADDRPMDVSWWKLAIAREHT